MDRLFLARLVHETVPALTGRRARRASAWASAGFSIPLGGRPPLELVFSFFPAAPGFYVGTPPEVEAAEPKAPTRLGPRFKSLLTGAELLSAEVSGIDRVVSFHWRRRKASGASFSVDLVVEWAGLRGGAFLVDPRSGEVLDVFAAGAPRRVAGERFEPPPPPPGAGAIPQSASEFDARLALARASGIDRKAAFRAATGLPPLLADEVAWLQKERGISEAEAFLGVIETTLKAGRPVLLRPPAAEAMAPARLCVIPLQSKPGWTETPFDTWNEAARAFVSDVALVVERSERASLRVFLTRALKKERRKCSRLTADLAALPDPSVLRVQGELLLAGLKQARPVDGGVEVPDIYSEEARWVRVGIDPRFDLVGNAQRFFRRGRKAERSRRELDARLASSKARLDYLETLELSQEAASTNEALRDLADELREAGIATPASRGDKSRPVRRLGPRRFKSSHGSAILVGRSARGNDELTFRIAGPRDLWFHAAETPGAHVVLRSRDGHEAPPEEVEEAAAAAAFFSKARGAARAEVAYTARQNVGRIPGAPPGTVRLSEFRSLRVAPKAPAVEEQ